MFWMSRVKSIKNYIYGILASRAIDWYIYGSNWRGGWGGSEFFGPPLQNFPGPLFGIINISEILSSSPVNWHPFCANWVKGGVCVHAYKSEPRAHGCGPRGV